MHWLAVNDPHAGYSSIIPRPEHIKLITGMAYSRSQTHSRHGLSIFLHRIICNVFPQPAEIQQLPHASMDGAVAHQNQCVSLFSPESKLINFLAVNLPDALGNFHQLAVPDKNAAGIVKLHQIGITAVENLQNAECGVCHSPYLTYWQSLHNSIHALIQSGAV